jgi:hypothetical protein
MTVGTVARNAVAKRPSVAGGPQVTPKPKQCHCSPHPHHPCPHTAASTAKAKAAKAKSARTRAANLARAQKILAAHPPTKAQIAKAIMVAKAQRKGAAYVRAQKIAHMTAGQKTAAQYKRNIAVWKAGQTRLKHKAQGVKPVRQTASAPKPLPHAFLAAALKTVAQQNKALAASKVKHHRAVNNPHKPAAKKVAKKKC